MRSCEVDSDVFMEEVVLYIIVRDMLIIYGEQGNYVPPLPVDPHNHDTNFRVRRSTRASTGYI